MTTTFEIKETSEAVDKESGNKTVTTTVEFTFDNKDKVTVDVAHFNPQSDDDLFVGISNRAVSERRKLYGEIKLQIGVK